MNGPGLPGGWETAPLGDLGRWVGGGTPSKAVPSYWVGTIPWISAKDMKSRRITSATDHISEDAVENSAASLIPPESVLVVVRSGILEHTLPIAVNKMTVTINQDLKALSPSGGLRAEYIAHALDAASESILRVCKKEGTTVASIELSRFLDFRIPVAPLPEQDQIVSELDTQFARLQAAVDEISHQSVRLEKYRAAVLKAACEGRLVPTEAELARAEGREFEGAQAFLARALGIGGYGPYQDPRLPQQPEGWCWATLGNVAEVQGGILKNPTRAPKDNAYPFLRVANVGRGELNLSEIHHIELREGELSKWRLNEGDLLIVEGNGSPSEIGRMAIWNGIIKNAVHQNHLIRARMSPGLLPRFIEIYWNSPSGKGRVLREASSTSGLFTLSARKVSRLPILVAPPPEQHRIIAEVERRLSVVEQVEAAIARSLQRAARLRQAILKQAFEGRLVPQDPNDEPASVLLERIRKERESRPSKTRHVKRRTARA